MSAAKNMVYAGRSLLSVRFLLAAFILVVSSVGLRPAVRALSQYYRKEPVAIRKPLKEFDVSRLSSFRGWTHSYENLDEIGEKEYVNIHFARGKFSGGSLGPELLVTYSSDPKDKVPHTTEVCARQAGAIVKKLSTIVLDTPQLAPANPQVTARLLLLQMPKNCAAVFYLFCVEGQFKYSREQVRWIMAKPGNRHVYFSKVEAFTFYPCDDDPAEAIQMCKQLICEALPILVAEYFPSAEQIKRR